MKINKIFCVQPEGWSLKKFEDLFDITSSKRIHAKDYVKSGIPFYRGTEITNRNKKIEFFISEEKYKEICKKYKIPQIGDILITAVGTIGSTLLIKNNNKFYFKDGNIIWLKKKTENISDFIYIFLNGAYAKKHIFNLGDGSAYGALPIQKFKNFEILLPTVKQQKQIYLILSHQELLLSNLKSLIKELETQLSYFTEELLSGRLRITHNEKGEVKLYKNTQWKSVEVNGEMVEIPVDWGVEKIRDFGALKGGGTPNTEETSFWNGNIPWVGPKEMSKISGAFIEKGERFLSGAGAKKLGNKKISSGAVVISTRAPIGYVKIAKNDLYTNQGCHSIVLAEEQIKNKTNMFLYYFINKNKELLEKHASGTTFLEIGNKSLGNIDVVTPTATEVLNISDFLLALSDNNENYKELLSEKQKQFDFLLDKLMTGEYQFEMSDEEIAALEKELTENETSSEDKRDI